MREKNKVISFPFQVEGNFFEVIKFATDHHYRHPNHVPIVSSVIYVTTRQFSTSKQRQRDNRESIASKSVR